MTGALIILAFTVVVGAVLRLTHRPDPEPRGEAPAAPAPDGGEECCGRHAVCEKTAAAFTADDHYDDEELDRFAGREPADYTDVETEEFRQVLYTLLPSDVHPWGVSLTRRGIALPVDLRDEWIMLCDDAASPSATSAPQPR